MNYDLENLRTVVYNCFLAETALAKLHQCDVILHAVWKKRMWVTAGSFPEWGGMCCLVKVLGFFKSDFPAKPHRCHNMSVLLYVHLKNYVFPISLPFPLHQGNTLSLPNVVTSLVNFLTAYKRFWRLCGLAGTSDSKNPELYYSDFGITQP